jgi:hypothetical protein
MIANACLTVISVGTFEVRQMLTQGTEYLSSFWNINDILVFCFAIVMAFLEIHNVRTAVYENEDPTLPLKRKFSGGTDSSNEETAWNSNLNEQLLRVFYAFSILSSFIKLLQVSQIHPSVGFLVQMLSLITGRAMPFISFFI